MFTAQHYTAIANALRPAFDNMKPGHVKLRGDKVLYALLEVFGQDNPNFDPNRFMDALGIGQERAVRKFWHDWVKP